MIISTLQETVSRAPVRGGILPNRKAQFAKMSREPFMKSNTHDARDTALFSKVNQYNY